MIPIKQRIEEAAEAVQKARKARDECFGEAPSVIIVTGSGLGSIAERVTSARFEMSYEDIPHLPKSTTPGHNGRMIIGNLGARNTRVLVLDGRIHGYEGHDPLTQVLPFLVANKVCEGAALAVLTNAAGAINENYHVGSIMLIRDHINFTGETLVSFSQDSDFDGSNLDMSFCYTPHYHETLRRIAYLRCELLEGVYIGVKGAMFETPAEIRAFRVWGADAVGMSTVHEATAASRLGIDVVGLSVMTNMAAGITNKRLTHEEVLETTATASEKLAFLIVSLLDDLKDKKGW